MVKTRLLFIISIAALVYMGARDWQQKPVVHPPGVLVNAPPVQTSVQPFRFEMKGYILTHKATFDITARVLGTESYYRNRESDLSHIDLALGWGVMSDESLLNQLDISQSNRWYRWKYEYTIPVSNSQIIANSSNMHMIPASDSIENTLEKLRVGDIVSLHGYLVDVDHKSGWQWRTSMSRTDTGDGACEIVYVESMKIEDARTSQ